MTSGRNDQFVEVDGTSLLILTLFAGPAVAGLVIQDSPRVAAAVVVLVLVMGLLFSRLATVVRDDTVTIWLGGVWPVASFAVADVAKIGRFTPSMWAGLGIRLLPEGMMYSIGFSDAVSIELRSGRKLYLGSKRPDALVRFLDRYTPAQHPVHV
jgi:hypothetical protein